MLKKLILIFVMLSMVAIACAEEKKMTPREQRKNTKAQEEIFSPEKMQEFTKSMTPLFGDMTKVMLNAQLDILAEPETAEKLATFTRNYYSALIKKGFTKEEAFAIAKAVGFPVFPMQK